jgi:small-conductance mechanosensitive channel
VLFTLMATLATVLLFRLVQRTFPRLYTAVENGRTTWIPAVRIQKLELLSANNLADALLWVLGVMRMAVLALLLYVSLPIILSFFPWTERYADRLFGYIIAPFAAIWTSFFVYLPNLFAMGAVVVFTWYMLKLVRLFFVGIARGNLEFSGFYPDWAVPTYKIVRFVVIIFAFIAIWPYLPGSDSKAFQGVGVLLGLLISFGSASAISNVVGGVVLTYMRPFRVGDRVKIADTVGDVIDKDLLVTRIRTIKNVDITVPNSMVLGSHIVNYSSTAKHRGLILNTAVTIGYDVPWRQVHELLIAAAAGTPGILAEPAPFVLQTSLDDFYVSYEVNAYTDQPNKMALMYSGLHANIQDHFNEAGVEIMSPHYRAPRDGNQTTIPAQYLRAGYEAPAFRVSAAGGQTPTFAEGEGE